MAVCSVIKQKQKVQLGEEVRRKGLETRGSQGIQPLFVVIDSLITNKVTTFIFITLYKPSCYTRSRVQLLFLG